jgi:RNA recognition motif-containing protein
MCTASGCVSPSPGEGEEGEEGSCSPGTRQVAGELSSGRSRSKHQRIVQRKCLETSSNADANPTTIMLRNIPNRYSQRELMLELEELGFEDCFDFVYLPFDKATGLNLGYAFVNFVHSSHYEKCFTTFEEHRFTRYQEGNYKKVAKVSRAHLQGLEANVAHYENTAVKTSKHRRRRPLVLAKKYSTIP